MSDAPPTRTVKLQSLVPYALGAVLLGACMYLLYTGVSQKDDAERLETEVVEHVRSTSMERTVSSRDDAVLGFLRAAQELAEVYKFTNGGSYQGLCEFSDSQYTFEGESGGILKYIKFVGATGVYCATADDFYMIEAKMPENGMFYCIDPTYALEQPHSRQGQHSCQ